MTSAQVRQLLLAQSQKIGSQAALAKQLGVSAVYLSDVIRGKREPAETICAALGIERVVTYRKMKSTLTNGE